MNVHEYMIGLGKKARAASRHMMSASTADKNNALHAIAASLNERREAIKSENQKDLDAGKLNQLDPALLDRLALNDDRIDGMIEGLTQVAALPDPCGEITDLKRRPSGIQVGKMPSRRDD